MSAMTSESAMDLLIYYHFIHMTSKQVLLVSRTSVHDVSGAFNSTSCSPHEEKLKCDVSGVADETAESLMSVEHRAHVGPLGTLGPRL